MYVCEEKEETKKGGIYVSVTVSGYMGKERFLGEKSMMKKGEVFVVSLEIEKTKGKKEGWDGWMVFLCLGKGRVRCSRENGELRRIGKGEDEGYRQRAWFLREW